MTSVFVASQSTRFFLCLREKIRLTQGTTPLINSSVAHLSRLVTPLHAH